ncbi:hypothetical protein Tco_0768836 [Tanacetum coccineum]
MLFIMLSWKQVAKIRPTNVSTGSYFNYNQNGKDHNSLPKTEEYAIVSSSAPLMIQNPATVNVAGARGKCRVLYVVTKSLGFSVTTARNMVMYQREFQITKRVKERNWKAHSMYMDNFKRLLQIQLTILDSNLYDEPGIVIEVCGLGSKYPCGKLSRHFVSLLSKDPEEEPIENDPLMEPLKEG